MRNQRRLLVAIAFESALAALAWIAAWALDIDPRRWLQGWQSAAIWGWALLATGPLLLALWWERRLSWQWVSQLRETARRLVGELLPPLNWPARLALGISAGVGEELLFRGLILEALRASGGSSLPGDVAAVLVSSLLFGAMHSVSVPYFAVATAVGAYFGCLTIVVHSTVPAIVAHGLYDAIALWYLATDRRRPTAHGQ